MINQFFENFNIDYAYMCLVDHFESIKDIYEQMLVHVLGERVVRIGCPMCGTEYMDFTIHGKYQRSVIDLVDKKDEKGNTLLGNNGNVIFEDLGQKIRMDITRIKCKEDGSTHALLFYLVVPYGKYSLRYIVYHLHEMIHSKDSMVGYCTKRGINVLDMEKWIKCLEENGPLLQQANLIPETEEMDKASTVEDKDDATHSDNRKMKNITFLKNIIDFLYDEFKTIYRASITFFKHVIFQTHKNPTNTVYHFA